MDRIMRRRNEELMRKRNMSMMGVNGGGGGPGKGGMAGGDMGDMHHASSETGTREMMMQSAFFLATEVQHLIVEKWTGDAIIDFAIAVSGAVILSFIWQGMGRLNRFMQHKLHYYAKLELQLVTRDRHHRRDRSDTVSKRPAYLYHNGHVFHQSADYMELLDAHHERQMNLDGNTAAQLQRQKQRNASLLEGSKSPSSLALEDGEEDVFLDPNATHHTTVDPRTFPMGNRGRSQSSGSRHERNLSIDMDPNRWNSLQRSKRGYIGNHSRVGLKCYRFLYHSILSINHTLKFAIGYILMLVVMTFNGWLLIAVVSGAVLGYFLFSADLQTVAARSEGIVLTQRMRQRRLENIRPQTIQSYQ